MTEREKLVVASKIKEYIKSKACQTSSDALDALNNRLHEMLDKAVERAKENKRATVRPHDF